MRLHVRFCFIALRLQVELDFIQCLVTPDNRQYKHLFVRSHKHRGGTLRQLKQTILQLWAYNTM